MFCLASVCQLEQLASSSPEFSGFKVARKKLLIWKHRRHGTSSTSALLRFWCQIVRHLPPSWCCRIFFSPALHPACCHLPLWWIRMTTSWKLNLFAVEEGEGEGEERLQHPSLLRFNLSIIICLSCKYNINVILSSYLQHAAAIQQFSTSVEKEEDDQASYPIIILLIGEQILCWKKMHHLLLPLQHDACQ